MAASVRWTGLDELRAALRNLPADLAQEASSIVIGAAHDAQASMKYPRRTGNLADHMKIDTTSEGRFGAGARLRNTAKHAGLFEIGTQARHTRLGANRGTMPAGHIFVPAVIRARRAMYERLKALLVKHGAIVSGDA